MFCNYDVFKSGKDIRSKKFINQCNFVGIDGVIIVDSNLNSPEEKILINGLSKTKLVILKIISPTNDDEFIKQSIKNCRNSWLYITSYFGLTGSKNVNINNVKTMIKELENILKKYL